MVEDTITGKPIRGCWVGGGAHWQIAVHPCAEIDYAGVISSGWLIAMLKALDGFAQHVAVHHDANVGRAKCLV